jgi:predicted flavoprotein YhiN
MRSPPLLRAWLVRLDAHGVILKTRHRWQGWDNQGSLQFATPRGCLAIRPDMTILALGGASWPRLGSDGRWVEPLQRAGIKLVPFEPANGGSLIEWSRLFKDRFEGQSLKASPLNLVGIARAAKPFLPPMESEGGDLCVVAGFAQGRSHRRAS